MNPTHSTVAGPLSSSGAEACQCAGDYSREILASGKPLLGSAVAPGVTLIEIRLFPYSMESKLTPPERQEALWLRSIAYGQTAFGAGMNGS